MDSSQTGVEICNGRWGTSSQGSTCQPKLDIAEGSSRCCTSKVGLLRRRASFRHALGLFVCKIAVKWEFGSTLKQNCYYKLINI